MTEIGEQMRAFREHLGWNQRAMGRVLGVSRYTICKYETGGKVPRRSVRVLFHHLRRDYRAGRLREWLDC